jgi:CheY-like chemotaxis protein
VETAKSGDEGLERIGEKMPDILFLDIRMPVMDGPKDATVAVAVTASVFDHQRQDYLDGGFSGFLDKPLRVEQIYQCLSE